MGKDNEGTWWKNPPLNWVFLLSDAVAVDDAKSFL